jgi:hypothetical protein
MPAPASPREAGLGTLSRNAGEGSGPRGDAAWEG